MGGFFTLPTPIMLGRGKVAKGVGEIAEGETIRNLFGIYIEYVCRKKNFISKVGPNCVTVTSTRNREGEPCGVHSAPDKLAGILFPNNVHYLPHAFSQYNWVGGGTTYLAAAA